MEFLEKLPTIINKCKDKALKIINGQGREFFKDLNPLKHDSQEPNRESIIYKSDNIYAIKDLIDRGYRGKLDLIYIDPPFFTMNNFNNKAEVLRAGERLVVEYWAYTDVWKDGFIEYIEMLTIRLFMMKELLSDRGSIYVHLDYRSVHYIKVVMDHIFGHDRFLNEIIWSYKSGGSSQKQYSKKHDTILLYSKSENYIFNPQKEKSYNRGYKPYRFKGVKEYEDEKGWYTLVNLKDVWDINIIGRTSKERVGYGTQKPEELLERIILVSSNEGSLVGDFFAGSGTSAIVAEKNKRSWIVSDMGPASLATIIKRLNNIGAKPSMIMHNDKVGNSGLVEFEKTLYIHGGKIIIYIELKNYKISLDEISFIKNHRETIEEAGKVEALNMLDYIGLGYLYKEDNFKIIWENHRDKHGLMLDKTFKITIADLGYSELYFKFVDIFGQVFYEEIKIR